MISSSGEPVTRQKLAYEAVTCVSSTSTCICCCAVAGAAGAWVSSAAASVSMFFGHSDILLVPPLSGELARGELHDGSSKHRSDLGQVPDRIVGFLTDQTCRRSVR